MSERVVVTLEDAARLDPTDRAALVAAGVEVVAALPAGPALALGPDRHGRWGLTDPTAKRGPVLAPDFTDGATSRRVRMTWNTHEPLRNALGASKTDAWSVVDATCGQGRDAWMIAAWGHAVVSYERHPVLAWLVRRAWAAAGAPASPAFRLGEATTHREGADAVYLDPMFPPSRKSAEPSGDVQLLRRLLGGAAPPDGLLDWALGIAGRRVVVKRPRRAPPLEGGHAPSFALEGKASRFDVYVRS